MNLLELQNILGKVIQEIIQEDRSEEQHKKSLEKAEYIAKVSKQMINNADIILRSEKLISEGKKMPNITKLIDK